MGEDVAGCAARSVVVVGEGTAGRSEALGALSSGVSSKVASSGGLYPSPVYASWTPLSTLSPRKLHPVFHLKGGICVQKKRRAVSAWFHLKTENSKTEESQIYSFRLSAECK